MDDAQQVARLRAVLREICEHEECCCEGGFDRFCTACTARGALEDEPSPDPKDTLRAARQFFDAATAWADIRERAHPNDKREQEAWERLFALYNNSSQR